MDGLTFLIMLQALATAVALSISGIPVSDGLREPD